MNNWTFSKKLLQTQRKDFSSLKLDNGSRVAVIGGGPAGSFFSYFLLDMAERAGLKIHVDIYEPRDFDVPGPSGCNMCGGVIYESLVQSLAVEGINLPTTVVQRGMDYNMLHLDSGNALIQTPKHEKRIAATFRGIGPRGMLEVKGGSLDRYLLDAALGQGAKQIRSRVEEVRWAPMLVTGNGTDNRLEVKAHGREFRLYDFVAVAAGINTALLKQFVGMDFGYQPPQTTKLVVREYFLGEEVVSRYIGPVFHAFLLNIPGLDYGAIIPKGDYVTICLLSSHKELRADEMDLFLKNPAVKHTLPPDFSPGNVACLCGPRINIKGSKHPYGDRIVFIGDSGVSRLYKDGIGAAYRTAKMAAGTAIHHGISASAFEKYYLPFCRKIERDNRIGKLLFKVAGLIQKVKNGQYATLKMISIEQNGDITNERNMSMVLWDMLTGGAPYLDVLFRTLHPVFLTRLLYHLLQALVHRQADFTNNELFDFTVMKHAAGTSYLEESTRRMLGALGKIYQHGDVIIRQGETGNSMYVIQEGYVEILKETNGQEVQLAILGKDDFFGEMAIFEKEVRGATVRALGIARILTIDSKNLLRRIHEEPSLAYRLLQIMSSRVRKLGDNYALFSNAVFSQQFLQDSKSEASKDNNAPQNFKA
jgi:CRP-like cAMP-binding protein/flavin-dependent dehydrogenase